eukprot:CAMPEP_0203662204 /NCGR_PEP_ID=MMETSP0090-20130426/252_1 /ASSEMBLY_ACC=CAM_ASM_001088 /TAXON_ID=426623 /ORGANISM="Chaetoceros affinis, Strain CCMP159" /LENGTH=223 /DNA_ID=CAMNT_0050524961 /DNA_START=61 /DNA_END=732 /DNA_ORIENTATION=-
MNTECYYNTIHRQEGTKMRRRGGVRSKNIDSEERQSSHDSCQSIDVGRSFARRGAVILNSKEIVPQIQLHSSSDSRKQKSSTAQQEASLSENFHLSLNTLDDFFDPYSGGEDDDTSFHCEDDDRAIQHTSEMDILIDKKKGFHVDYEGNTTFIEILRTHFADMYSEARSKTHRRIILSTILAEMDDRGFRFLLIHNNQYYFIQDELFILRKIRKVLREELKDL